MSKALKYTFVVHAIVSFLFGVPLLLAPGSFLGLFGWAPIDPLISRLLGAAVLALAWGSVRGSQAMEVLQVKTLVEMEMVYTILGCVGLLRHLLIAYYPWYVWTIFVVLALFAIAWIVFFFKIRRKA
jgi:hypothetical protein